MLFSRRRIAWIGLWLLLSTCRSTSTANGCGSDGDCGAPASAFRCVSATGQCYCRNELGCGANQTCNASGFCQDKTGCEKNSDCGDPSLLCETSSGTCIAKGRCASDLQCALGQVCDGDKGVCVVGCRSGSDCNGSSCRCQNETCQCQGTSQLERMACSIGVCDATVCADDSFCRFGERCEGPTDGGVLGDGGSAPRRCRSDYDSDLRPYCDNCTSGGGTQTCGIGANYCLIDTRRRGSPFCGADCAEGQSCPRGYSCQEVIVVSRRQSCSKANPTCAPDMRLSCSNDTECKHGGTCIKAPGQATGACAGKCAIEEGDQAGFCSCQVDSDCAQDTCSQGECTISRRRCINPEDCRRIRCVDFEGGGGCFIGQNCAPANGLTCVEVR